jgi:hypothetical protein
MGLCKKGLDIWKELDDSHASLQEREVLRGKMTHNNGFKYESYYDPSLISKTLELYLLIYQIKDE